jgi:hypothetical protein
VFTFVFSSSAGYQDVFNSTPHILFSNGGSSGTDLCWFIFYPSGIALAPDNLQGGWAGMTYGSNAVAQNSQCSISGAGSSVSASGNTVTLTLSVIFRPTYAGMKTIYTDVNSSGYAQPVGTYNVTATLSTDSVSPQNGRGSSQVLTFMLSDPAGYQDLISGKYHILINTAPSGTSSCWMLLQSNGLSLAPDDPGQAWAFVPYGSAGIAQNSQCAVNGVGTSISGSGDSLTLSLSLTFTAAYAGTKNVYTDVNSIPTYVAATTYMVQ